MLGVTARGVCGTPGRAAAMESLQPNDSLAALKAREAELRRLNDQLERRKAVVVRRAEEAVVCELRCVRLHCT